MSKAITDIPAGYTYMRCDRYTPEEFRDYCKERKLSDICVEYMLENPKAFYDTDDVIEIHYIRKGRSVPGLIHGQNRKSTKRTWYYD